MSEIKEEFITYTIDGRKFVAIMRDGPEFIHPLDLVNLLASWPCALSRFTALKRNVFLEATLGREYYEASGSNSGGAMAPVAVSQTPQFFHLLPHYAALAQRHFDAAQLGDAFIVYARRLFQNEDASRSFTVNLVLAIIPWFAIAGAFVGGQHVPWSVVVPNMDITALTPDELRMTMRCEKIRPMLPFSRPNQPDVTDAQIEALAPKILAFVLHWHQTRTSLHPQLVRLGLRASDRAAVERENKRLNVDLERWRIEQLRCVLHNRSFRFFGASAPRHEIFESPLCWQVLAQMLARFATPTLANFVIREILDVLRFVIETEVLMHGEAAVYDFLLENLRTLCEGISAADAAALDAEGEFLTSADVPPQRPQTTAYMILNNAEKRAKAAREPLDMKVESVGELRERARVREALGVNDPTQLSRADIEYLSLQVMPDDFDDSTAEQHALMENLTRNLVVVSHNFAFASETLEDVLFSRTFGKHGNEYPYNMVRHGRRFITAQTAVEMAILATRAFLHAAVGTHANEVVMTGLEESFAAAAPKNGGFYSEETRSKAFDDISIASDDFMELRAQYVGPTLSNFLTKRTGTLELPPTFDMARARGLLLPNAALVRSLPRTGTLHSAKNGSVEVHRLALHTVCHRERCYLKRPHSDVSNSAAHIDLEYDTGGDTGLRFDKLLRIEAQVRPLSHATLAAAVRSADRRDRHALDDIEDIVSNMYHNRALPLCVRAHARTIEQRVGLGYLQEDGRLPFYKLLRSFTAPEMTPEAIMRFMFKNSPAGKIGGHFSEGVTGWEKAARKSHAYAAEGYKKVAGKNMREVTLEEAETATTCATSCSTMINHQRTCPFLLPDAELIPLLTESGIAHSDIERIISKTGNPGLQCRMQFELSRADETRATPPFSDFTRDVYFKHPHQYMLAAADHLLRHEENLVGVVE